MVYRVGITLAAFTGGYLFLFHQRLPYIMVGLATIAAGIVTFFAIEPKIDSEKFTLINYIKQTKIGFAQLWKTPYIRDFSLYYISIGGITWYYLYFLYNVFMTDAGFSPAVRGWLGGINSILVGIIAFSLIRFKMLTRVSTYVYFPIILCIGFFIAPLSYQWISAISIFLIYLAGITRYIFLDQYANQEFDSKYRATAISALSMAISLVYFLLSFIMNPILSRYGSQWVMFALGIITMVTAVPTVVILLKNHSNK